MSVCLCVCVCIPSSCMKCFKFIFHCYLSDWFCLLCSQYFFCLFPFLFFSFRKMQFWIRRRAFTVFEIDISILLWPDIRASQGASCSYLSFGIKNVLSVRTIWEFFDLINNFAACATLLEISICTESMFLGKNSFNTQSMFCKQVPISMNIFTKV